MDFSAFIKENYKDNERIARMSINAPEHNGKVFTYHYKASELAEESCNENNLWLLLRFKPYEIR